MKNKITLMMLVMFAVALFSTSAYAGSCSGGAKATVAGETAAEK